MSPIETQYVSSLLTRKNDVSSSLVELITFTESECSQKILNFQKIDKDSLKNRKIRNNNKIYMIEIVKFYKNMLKTAPNKKPHQITHSACFR